MIIINKNLLFVFIFIFLFSNVSSEIYYVLDIHYESGELTLNSIDAIYSRFPILNPNSDSDIKYFYELIDNDGGVAFSDSFVINNFELNESFYENGTSDIEYTYFDSYDFQIYIPYTTDVSNIIIKKDELTVLSVEEASFFESNINKDETRFLDSYEKDDESFLFYLYFFLFLLLLVLGSVISYYYFTKRKK